MTDLRRLAHAAVVTGFVGPTVPDWLARRIDAGLGGVCWFAQNVEDEAQATDLAAKLHGLGAVLVMSDEEGGDVTRLEAATGVVVPEPRGPGRPRRRRRHPPGRGRDGTAPPRRRHRRRSRPGGRRERRPREPRDRHAVLRRDTRPRGPTRRRVRHGPAGRRRRCRAPSTTRATARPAPTPTSPCPPSTTRSRCCSRATWRRSGRRSRPACVRDDGARRVPRVRRAPRPRSARSCWGCCAASWGSTGW